MKEFESGNPFPPFPNTNPAEDASPFAAEQEQPNIAPSYEVYIDPPEYAEKITELRPMIKAASMKHLYQVDKGNPQSPWKWDLLKREFANELQEGYGLTKKQLEGFRLYHLLEGSSPDEKEVPIVGFDINNPNAESGKIGAVEDFIRRMNR